MQVSGRKGAFFDRDGTINVDEGYTFRVEDLRWVNGTPELIRAHNDAGDVVVVVTNQSGIARGFYTSEDVESFHLAMNSRLKAEFGAHIDAFYYCPHLPGIGAPCTCRKPAPGLFLRAIAEWGIDPSISVSYGDSRRDAEASKAAGISKFVYVNPQN